MAGLSFQASWEIQEYVSIILDWLFYGLTAGILILTAIVLTDAIRKNINERNEQES